MGKFRILPVFAAIVSMANTLSAKLEFDRTTLEVKIDAGSEEPVSGDFKFTNRGTSAVNIVHVRPECGCTTTSLTKTAYAAGESGLIPLRLNPGTLSGRTIKRVSIVTDEPEDNYYVVALDVEVIEWFTLTPRLLFWRAGEKPVSKKLEITLNRDEVKIIRVSTPPDLFTVDVQPAGPGRKTIISVTPVTNRPGTSATLEIDFQVGGERQMRRTIFLRLLSNSGLPAPF
jgi:hypothetical protein